MFSFNGYHSFKKLKSGAQYLVSAEKLQKSKYV